MVMCKRMINYTTCNSIWFFFVIKWEEFFCSRSPLGIISFVLKLVIAQFLSNFQSSRYSVYWVQYQSPTNDYSHYPSPSRMASILSSLFGQTKLYEPSPRFGHGAAAVGRRCYLWGGRVQDFSVIGRKKLASTIDIFDPHLETWEKHPTTGVPPSGLYYGACTSLLDSLYWFGGWDNRSYYNSLHRLDTTTREWRELQPLNQADGPMRKSGCGMVSFLQDQLAVLGGYGILTGPTQPGATEATDFNNTDGSGWSNELHVFNIMEGMWALHCLHDERYAADFSVMVSSSTGKWSSPPTTGPRPPPCAHFSFTAVNNHQAVFFGGRQLHGRVSDCYLMDFESMVCPEIVVKIYMNTLSESDRDVQVAVIQSLH